MSHVHAACTPRDDQISAVIQGLRGDKGESGNPGLPGFSGPKGPAVSTCFFLYLKMIE